ncbi:MAG: hypothetical protein J1F22_00505 [Lachnospiraceae bacterium]|nr:hypothetical protein [Lachnospiraceae bacterium]
MKHILCFGDSNTHGYIPGGGRYDDNTRWTKVLGKLLGPDFDIIEEGLNGRTSSFDDPLEPFKNAMDYIIPCLKTHEPLDLIILMLGSNDMKERFSPSVEKIASSLHDLTQIILEVSNTPVLLVSPILLGKNICQSVFRDSFSESAPEISRQLAGVIEKIALHLGTDFLDASLYADPSPEDGLHLTPEGHQALAKAFYNKLITMKI